MSARDPTRLREQRSLDPELRALLDVGRRYAPSPEQLGRLAQRVEAEAHASEDARPRRPRLSATGAWYVLGALTLMAAGSLVLSTAFGPEHGSAAGVATASVRPAAHGGGAALARAEAVPSIARAARGSTRTSPPPAALPAEREAPAFEARAPAPQEQPRPLAIGGSTTLARDEPESARASGSDDALAPAAHRANSTRRIVAVPRASIASSARTSSAVAAVQHASTRFASSSVPERTAEPRPSELALLGQAQALLASDASAALARLGEHARLYPHAAFAEEREALAIDALQRLGRRAELRERGRAFLANYPRSAQRGRVLEWLR